VFSRSRSGAFSSRCGSDAERGQLGSWRTRAASRLAESSIEMRATIIGRWSDGTTMVTRTKEDLVRLSDESLRGRTVISADGKAIGSLVALFISSDWRVESIRIALQKDIADRIGASRTLLHRGTIELPANYIQSVGDAVVLSIDVEKLREAHRSPERDVALPPST
jgi:sporulation protein YlmC with PRC-barrel domain